MTDLEKYVKNLDNGMKVFFIATMVQLAACLFVAIALGCVMLSLMSMLK